MDAETRTRTHWADDAALSATYPEHIQTVCQRHDAALERAGAAHLVVYSGAPKLRFQDDYHYPFQPNPLFLSWLPLTAHPHCYLVYTPGETPKLIYYQEKDYWHAPPAPPEGYWTRAFDLRIVHAIGDIAEQLPVARDKCILLGEIHDDAEAFGIERINPGTAVNILHYARAEKTAYELACLRGASRRAVAGHRAAEAAFRDGRAEFDIHLAYCEATGQTDRDLPYNNIIALNENGAVLHYQHKEIEPPGELRSFLIDAGASVNGYAADITRSYATETGAFSDLIEQVDTLQQSLVAEVRAGVDYPALHAATHERIAALLVELGIARGSVEALIAQGVTSAFYPHGLGHLLGLQVHDVGGFMGDDNGTAIDPPPAHPFLRLTRTLQTDQVLTIEPGVYFIDMLLEGLRGTPGHAMIDSTAVDHFRPYGGVRVEDNVRVLDDGCENLTRDAFAA